MKIIFISVGIRYSLNMSDKNTKAKLAEAKDEYDNVADLALQAGYSHFVPLLKEMSVAEARTRSFFKTKAKSYWVEQLGHNLFHAL